MPKNCRGFWHKNYGYVIFKGEVWLSEWSNVWYGAFETDYMKVQVNLPLDEMVLDYF